MNLTNEAKLKQDLQLLLSIEQGLVRVEANLGHVNSHVKEIDKNLQAVEVRIEKTNAILHVNTESLILHMKRSDTIEKMQQEDRSRYFQLMMSLVLAMAGVIITIALKR